MNPVYGKFGIVIALLLAVGGNVLAQERKAYRHVDASGNVTYSQTPPVDSTASKKVDKIDISPAQRGRGGDTGLYSAYDNPNYYGQGHDRSDAYSAYAANSAAAHERRLAALKADCERQRGTDCGNPAALRYQASTTLPRNGVVVRPPQRVHPRYPRRDG